MIAAASLLVILIAGTFIWFKIGIRPYYRALEEGDVQILNTSFGRMSYIDSQPSGTIDGSNQADHSPGARNDTPGKAVLAVHGNSGGYDQALSLGRDMVGPEHRIIAPSRFGYPGSSLPGSDSDGSTVKSSTAARGSGPYAQADAYAALLDHLQIDSVHVLAVSAGGGPALAFALKYPARTASLILVAAAVPPPAEENADGTLKALGPPRFLYNDFPFFLMVKLLPGVMRSIFGVSKELYAAASAEEQENLKRTIEGVLPVAPRRAGILNDLDVTLAELTANPNQYPLEEIEVPALLLASKTDPLASAEEIRTAASRIPDANLTVFPDGGHVFFREDVRGRIGRFLRGLE
jgi:pimeloyl-ACP methyl ester carboxylesterase